MRDDWTSLASRPWVLAVVPLAAIPFLAAYRLYDNDRRRITVSSLGELFATFNALSIYGFLLLIGLAGLGVDDGSLPKSRALRLLARWPSSRSRSSAAWSAATPSRASRAPSAR